MTEPDAYMILFGERREHRCLVLDRAIADQRAASLHGVKVPLVVPDEFRQLLTPWETPPHDPHRS